MEGGSRRTAARSAACGSARRWRRRRLFAIDTGTRGDVTLIGFFAILPFIVAMGARTARDGAAVVACVALAWSRARRRHLRRVPAPVPGRAGRAGRAAGRPDRHDPRARRAREPARPRRRAGAGGVARPGRGHPACSRPWRRQLEWDAAALWEVETRDGTLTRVHLAAPGGAARRVPGPAPGLASASGSVCPGASSRAGEPAWIDDVRDDPVARGGGAARDRRAGGRLPDHGQPRIAGGDRALLAADATARPAADGGDGARRPLHRPAPGAPPRGGGGARAARPARSGARVRHRLRDHDEPRGARGRVQPRGRADLRVPALGRGRQARARADRPARACATTTSAGSSTTSRPARAAASGQPLELTRCGPTAPSSRSRSRSRGSARGAADVRRLPARRHRAQGGRGERPPAGGDRRAFQRRDRGHRPATGDRRLEPRRRGAVRVDGREIIGRHISDTAPADRHSEANFLAARWPRARRSAAIAPCGCERTAASSTCRSRSRRSSATTTKPVGMAGIIRDITEEKRIEGERIRLLDQEKAARLRAEELEQRASFIAEAQAALDSSLKFDEVAAAAHAPDRPDARGLVRDPHAGGRTARSGRWRSRTRPQKERFAWELEDAIPPIPTTLKECRRCCAPASRSTYARSPTR